MEENKVSVRFKGGSTKKAILQVYILYTQNSLFWNEVKIRTEELTWVVQKKESGILPPFLQRQGALG